MLFRLIIVNTRLSSALPAARAGSGLVREDVPSDPERRPAEDGATARALLLVRLPGVMQLLRGAHHFRDSACKAILGDPRLIH